MPTVSRIKAIHTLLHLRGLMDEKQNIIRTFSDNRTDSSRAITDHEADELITYLQKLDKKSEEDDKMRKKILSMAHEMSWRIAGTGRIDMARVDLWCITYGKFHRRLDQHSHNQLPELVSQFEFMYKRFLNAL
jgi:hypothetical protein